jgi:hypothetical protein
MGAEFRPTWISNNPQFHFSSPKIDADVIANINEHQDFPEVVLNSKQVRVEEFADTYHIIMEIGGQSVDREFFSSETTGIMSGANQQLRQSEILCLLISEQRFIREAIEEVLLGGKKSDRNVFVEAMAQIPEGRDYNKMSKSRALGQKLYDWETAMGYVDSCRPAEPIPLTQMGYRDPQEKNNYLNGKQFIAQRYGFAEKWFKKSNVGKHNKLGIYNPKRVNKFAPTVVIGHKASHLSMSVQPGYVSYNPDNPDYVESGSVRVANHHLGEFDKEINKRWRQLQTFATELLSMGRIDTHRKIKDDANIFNEVGGVFNYGTPVYFVERVFDLRENTTYEIPYWFPTNEDRDEFQAWLTEFGLAMYLYRDQIEERLVEIEQIRNQPWTVMA